MSGGAGAVDLIHPAKETAALFADCALCGGAAGGGKRLPWTARIGGRLCVVCPRCVEVLEPAAP